MEFIPTKSIPSYSQQITLEGVIYEIGFTWNTRANAWFMDIGRDNLPLVSGIKIVDSYELISRFANYKLPPGILLSMDLGSIGRIPLFDELGTQVKLAYLTESEAENGII